MTTHSTLHLPAASGTKGLALVAGVLATSGALAILLQDAIRTGLWTIEHGLIPVLMAVQILTGHLFVAAARQKKALPALGFALVATVATWGVLDTSVAKQGAVMAEAAAKAEDVNGRLADKTAELAKARQRLADADKMVDLETGKGGCKSNCRDWKQRAAEVRSHITVIEAEIARLGPAQPVDARSENMAILLAALTGRDKATIKHVLTTVRPFAYALIFELAALVSFGFAFGHARHRKTGGAQPVAARPAFQADLHANIDAATIAVLTGGSGPDGGPPKPRGTRTKKRTATVVPFPGPHPVVQALESNGGTVASNQELARLMGVTEGESTKRVAEVAHLLAIRRIGKRREISLRAQRAA